MWTIEKDGITAFTYENLAISVKSNGGLANFWYMAKRL